MTKNEKRDVTRILNLAKKGARDAASGAADNIKSAAIFTQIAEIAKAVDARTGRRDPSVRKSAKRKKATR